jgi:hypothetical protein
MKPATISTLKQELKSLTSERLIEVCLRVAKYSAENKELITYILFDEENEVGFINEAKCLLDGEFVMMEGTSIYFAKKGLKRALKTLNKSIKFTKSKTTEIELRMHFCQLLKNFGLFEVQGPYFRNVYERQFVSIQKAVLTLNEDLQFDYGKELEKLILKSRYFNIGYASTGNTNPEKS